MPTDPLIDPQLLQALAAVHWEDILEAAPDAMLLVDGKGRILFCNANTERLLGYAHGELNGKRVEILVPERLRESHVVHRERYNAAPFNRAMGKGLDLVTVCKDGRELPVEISLSPLETAHGTLIVAGIHDMSHRRNAEALLSAMATLDPLTGLANKPLILDRLQQATGVARTYKHGVALILLDLDHFRRVNESFTHEGGDQILKLAAERLTAILPENATAARLGGDEFAVVVSNLKGVAEAATIAQRILHVMERPFEMEGQEFVLTASAGISVFPHDGSDAQTLYQNAEQAMYRAKEERNRVHQFDAAATPRVSERLTLENNLRKAIENDELFIHYQPQVSAVDGRIIGAEALIRWKHPQHGVVSPGQFIPLAEESGLIVPITEWVLATACEQAIAWQKAGLPPVRMAINLSACHLRHLKLIDTVRQTLDANGLSAKLLDLELTESLLMEHLDVALDLLNQLSDMGVRLSIDDFGTGYSSLSYLKRLPLHALKIDRTFIRDLTTDRSSEAIVRSVIDMAHHLSLDVVAEGVEEAEQFERLKELRCDQIQGFYYSRPVAASEFANLLACKPYQQQSVSAS